MRALGARLGAAREDGGVLVVTRREQRVTARLRDARCGAAREGPAGVGGRAPLEVDLAGWRFTARRSYSQYTMLPSHPPLHWPQYSAPPQPSAT